MRFYTKDECEAWLADRDRKKPETPKAYFSYSYGRDSGKIWQAATVVSELLPFRQPVLLWITEWGIWPSSENWHAYYRLRQTYQDNRLLHETPGHLFLEHESEDLRSFLQLAMLNGWGGYILPHANYTYAFFSHDEYIEFHSDGGGILPEIQQRFEAK